MTEFNQCLINPRHLRVVLEEIHRGGNTLNGFTDFRSESGASQGQNLALTGVFVPIRSRAEGHNAPRQRHLRVALEQVHLPCRKSRFTSIIDCDL